MRFKLYIICIPLFLLLSSCDESPIESEEPSLYLDPETLTVSVESPASFQLRLESIEEPIFGISLRIAYNWSFLIFNDTTGFMVGNYFGTDIVTFIQAEAGTIHLTVSMTQGQTAVNGSGELGQLTFVGRYPNTGAVEILPAELHFYDAAGDTLSISDLMIGSAEIIVE
jgi:hypothetical protein